MAKINTIPNFNIIKASHVPQTNTRGARIKLVSERFRQRKTISYYTDAEGLEDGQMLTHALKWLQSNGFEIVGRGEGSDHFYFISSTFLPLNK